MNTLLREAKRIITLILSLVIFITALPIYAFADDFEIANEKAQEEVTVIETIEENEAERVEAEEITDSEETLEAAEEELETENSEALETAEEEAEKAVEELEIESAEELETAEEEIEAEDAEVIEEAEEETVEAQIEEEVQIEIEAEEGLVLMTVTLDCGLQLTGMMPKNAVVEAIPVSVEIDGEEVLAAYDINIFENEEMKALGIAWQPEEGSISVSLADDSFGTEELNVYHTPEGGEPELVTTVGAVDGVVEFEAESFSVYTVSRSIEKVIETGDGTSYLVGLKYGKDAQIPEGADLAVRELEGSDYDFYLGETKELMNAAGFGYARIFDISIVDAEGNEIQPSAAVQVYVELLDDTKEGNFRVVHFGETREELSCNAEGNKVSFRTEGFSAYAIVQGPDPLDAAWGRVESYDEFLALGAEGLYIGHTSGYYFMDSLVKENNRTGIKKTTPAQTQGPAQGAAVYYFEAAGSNNSFYVYCIGENGRQYVMNANNNSLSFTSDEGQKTAFTVSFNSEGYFTLNNGAWFWNMQGGAGGKRFCAWNAAGDVNNAMYFWYHEEAAETDPLGLDGKSYGFMNWNGGTAGKALMANEIAGNALEALPLTVMTAAENDEDKLFVPNDSDITMWTFHWVEEDRYQITAEDNGSKKYLRIENSGLGLANSASEGSKITVVPGSGIHAGEIALYANGKSLCYSGNVETGFVSGTAAGNEWLKLTALSALTSNYFMTYSARKISVSSSEIETGSSVIVYTRSWDENKNKYVFYAIDHDGSLVPCYESGDSVQWVGSIINTLLWNFVEYYWEGTTEPNYYYELFNEYSEKYIAPNGENGEFLSASPVGINLKGRRNGYYYSSIVAWDDVNYRYGGLKVENGHIRACELTEADDFYFAVIEDTKVDDVLTEVPTVDHTKYGITMKIINKDKREDMSNYLGNNSGGLTTNTVAGLLSTDLKANGYPDAAKGSLANFYAGAREVNHLFIDSTYSGTGYYEFDSTQNFASLKSDNTFKVYKEIGTNDANERESLKHGQFLPFNDIEAGKYASVNRKNLYTAKVEELPDSDPRKNELLYLVAKPDFYFAVEIEAAFTQTPDGLDAWGHDIIYEFTGDDDFWLYVDGELIIDLGGIHSAIPGSVNYRTGEVVVNGRRTSLKELFYNNSIKRGASKAEAQSYVDGIFEQKNGNWVFKDYSAHTMRIFYMERGAGASNLYMRFNLASIRPGTVLLSKELSGIDDTESKLAEFPFQISYKTENGEEHILSQGRTGAAYVYYKDTVNPVNCLAEYTIDGIKYENVFMLRPNETAEIEFPEEAVEYSITECGVNTRVFDRVEVNGVKLQGSNVEGSENRKDFTLAYAPIKNRARAVFVNNVDPDALRTLTITKLVYDESGENEYRNPSDRTTFGFRLYFGTESSSDSLSAANMYTYHVKDTEGMYCRWDAESQSFVSLGKDDYTKLTNEEKASARFTTSMNGSITKIPGYYTVEIREILAGTTFMVEEREDEIPDGYSLQKYVIYEEGNEEESKESKEPVEGTIEYGKDHHVDVCNLRGWGLRVNKQWSDADYMEERDAAYFAIYTNDGNGNLTLVEGSVRRLSQNENSIYWYYLNLPVSGVPFERYEIKEVFLKGSKVTVNDDGIVDAYDSIIYLENGDEVGINGRPKGETTSSTIKYTVLYEEGQIEEDSHVRVDTVINNRPGIVLVKQDCSGNDLAGATFVLKDDKGYQIGEFTSRENGQITVAFLRDDVNYTLTETNAPQGYWGLQSSMTIRLHNGIVRVSGINESQYTLMQGAGTTPTLVIKNKKRSFEAIKVDGSTGDPLKGASFALHRQVTVNGVTSIDINPMSGYENIESGEDGLLEMDLNKLAPGTYELRETDPAAGYLGLESSIRFTVSSTGAVTLGSHPMTVDLKAETDEENVHYTLVIKNNPIMPAPTGYSGNANMAAYIAVMSFGLMMGITKIVIKMCRKHTMK